MLHPGMGLVSKLGIDINQGDRAGFTALMLSSRNGSSHGVGYLLDNGADCAIVAEDGLTALQFAAERGAVFVFSNSWTAAVMALLLQHDPVHSRGTWYLRCQSSGKIQEYLQQKRRRWKCEWLRA